MTNFNASIHCKIEAYYAIIQEHQNYGYDFQYYGLNDDLKREVLKWDKQELEFITYDDMVKYLKLINYIKNLPPKLKVEGLTLSKATTITGKLDVSTDLTIKGNHTI